jgi:actin-like ATPase involved in cell morphogenesis
MVLLHFINKASLMMKFVLPRVVIVVPSGIIKVEWQVVQESAIRAVRAMYYSYRSGWRRRFE